MLDGKDAHLDNLHAIRDQLLALLSGMDYCLDWKAEPSAWSARQVAYHLLDTPTGGIHRVLWGAVSGGLEDFEVWAGLDNITTERSAYDLEQIREDVEEFFTAMQEALEAAGDQDLQEKSVLSRHRTSGVDHAYTLQALLESMFDAHWRQHLDQISSLREALGM